MLPLTNLNVIFLFEQLPLFAQMSKGFFFLWLWTPLVPFFRVCLILLLYICWIFLAIFSYYPFFSNPCPFVKNNGKKKSVDRICLSLFDIYLLSYLWANISCPDYCNLIVSLEISHDKLAVLFPFVRSVLAILALLFSHKNFRIR